MNSLFPAKLLVATGPRYKDAGCTENVDVEVDLVPSGIAYRGEFANYANAVQAPMAHLKTTSSGITKSCCACRTEDNQRATRV
jgi:hypothetical protein